MSACLIAAVGCVYAYIGLEQLLKGNIAMAITYGGYAFGNIGLWMLAKAF